MADRHEITAAELEERVATRYGEDEQRAIVQAIDQTRTLDPEVALPRALDVAALLVTLRLPAATVVAGILEAGVAAHTDLGALQERYGTEVRALLEGVSRLDAIHWDHLEREASENLRKMFLAMASDVRVVLIALACRVHELRCIAARDPADRDRLARETLDVFAPLANRLGIWGLKWELEDLAFRQLEPQTYRDLGKLLAEKRADRRASIDEVMSVLRSTLAEAGIPAEIMGRPKHIYSIYKKMQRKRLPFSEIYDVSAVRVLVEEVGQCYAVLGLVHGLWQPIAGEFDDYIAKPKGNFYRSLHTAVVGPGGRSLEVQIRTREMHEQSEYGVAAHWRYKEGGAKAAARRFDEKINWLRQLMEWQKEVTDPADLAESLKTDVFSEQIFVFTPTDEVIDLPQGATPIDFAYRIHTQVGHRCRGAKVGGQIVPLDHELKTGDKVEIITAKQAKPSRDWLSPHLGYVKTASARAKIRSWFREQGRETSIAQGRDLLDRELRRLGVDVTHAEVARLYDIEDTAEFLARLGFGDISTQSVAGRILEVERERKATAAPPPPPRPPKPAKPSTGGVSIGDVSDVMSTPAKCCHPVPGDAVIGYVTRGRGVVIHRADCPNVQGHPEPERLMELTWGAKLGEAYPVDIQVIATDRAGLLRDIADVVTREGVNMRSARADNEDGLATLWATLDIRGSEQLVRVLHRLERLPYVQAVRRVAR